MTPHDAPLRAEDLRDIAAFPLFAYVPSTLGWVLLGGGLILGVLIARSELRRRARAADPFALVQASLDAPLSREGAFAVSRAVKRLLAAYGFGDYSAYTPGELGGAAATVTNPAVQTLVGALARLDALKYGAFDAAAVGAALSEIRVGLPQVRLAAEARPSRVGGA